MERRGQPRSREVLCGRQLGSKRLEKRRGDGDVHTVYLLRHAKSDWSDQTLPDHARPLAPRGRRDAKRIASHLRRRGIEPTLVLCSSAERTRETLDLVRPALGDAPAQIEDELYAAPSDQLLERLRALPEESDSVLVIGHNPGLQELALVLATPSRTLEAKFPTAALATLSVPDATWAQLAAGDAELTEFVVPKQLR
jgi:phosphohistidine phosphatase